MTFDVVAAAVIVALTTISVLTRRDSVRRISTLLIAGYVLFLALFLPLGIPRAIIRQSQETTSAFGLHDLLWLNAGSLALATICLTVLAYIRPRDRR